MWLLCCIPTVPLHIQLTLGTLYSIDVIIVWYSNCTITHPTDTSGPQLINSLSTVVTWILEIYKCFQDFFCLLRISFILADCLHFQSPFSWIILWIDYFRIARQIRLQATRRYVFNNLTVQILSPLLYFLLWDSNPEYWDLCSFINVATYFWVRNLQ